MKKKIAIIFVVILIICVLSLSFFINKSESAEIKEKFEVSKIHYYSNVNADINETTYENPEWNLDVYQYTDIAIYVDKTEIDVDRGNLEKVYIDNIRIENSEKGTQNLYYLNPLEFGSVNTSKSEEIEEKLEYSVIHDSEVVADIKYNIPLFLEDCSNPITIRYVNSKILDNYKIDGTETVSFDGSLLKNGKVDLEEIESKITLDLNLISNGGNVQKISLKLNIPLENESTSIYEKGIEKVEYIGKNEDNFLSDTNDRINISRILKANSGKVITEEMSREEMTLEHATYYYGNPELPSGTLHVTQVRK